MMGKIKNAWDLFNSAFKIGDDVILIDDEDQVYCGKLSSFNDEVCVLKRRNVKDIEFKWEWLMFMSHDGFPCRKLLGADGSKSIELIDTTSTQKAIRTALTVDLCRDCDRELISQIFLHRKYRGVCDSCSKIREHEQEVKRIAREQYLKDNPPQRTHSYMRGDPFLIENVTSELFNVGVCGEQSWNGHYEETLVLKAKDGAIAHLFALNTIYHMEITQ